MLKYPVCILEKAMSIQKPDRKAPRRVKGLQRAEYAAALSESLRRLGYFWRIPNLI